MHEYTSEELKRGRFLRHFMGLDRSHTDPTIEDVAVPADAQVPPTRTVSRPHAHQRR